MMNDELRMMNDELRMMNEELRMKEYLHSKFIILNSKF